MNWRIIGILASKDLSLFFRNKMITALTAVALVFYLVIYFVLPGSVDEDLEIVLKPRVSYEFLERFGP